MQQGTKVNKNAARKGAKSPRPTDSTSAVCRLWQEKFSRHIDGANTLCDPYQANRLDENKTNKNQTRA